MNSRNTLRWIIVAVALVLFILVHHRYLQKTSSGPTKVLPNLKAAAVTSIQVRPGAQLEIRAERTNGTWQLTEPMAYPAQVVSIEKLLAELERLTPAPYLTARELRDRPKAEEEYGLAAPLASIIIEQPGYSSRLRVGAKTAPGDQVFLQVVGVEGVYVVDADFLKYLPRTADSWRDTALISLNGQAFDRLAVTNATKIFELRRDAADKAWRMVYPLQARANNAKAEEALQMLQSIRVAQFVPDDPKAELETYGLQPPELEVALSQGTNIVARLQFGKSPTNDTRLVYARRLGANTIVAVRKDLLALWYAQVNDFRDPFLITWSTPAAVIDVRGQDSFSLQQQTNNTWRVLPQDFPADAALVRDLLTALSGLQIVEFYSDVATPPELPALGLAPPAQQYILRSATTNSPAGPTNAIIVEVDFGTNRGEKVFTRRSDESFVYAVKYADFQRLPMASGEMRERRIWNLSTNDVTGATIRQQGRVIQIVRNGPHDWSLAAGSQGTIKNVLAVEEGVRGLCQLTAVAWIARGDQYRARYGFTDNGHRITLELKNGDPVSVEFSGQASPNSPYAAVTLEGQLWIFQFPTWLYDYAQRYLSVPPNP
ncbi:MAG: DUF4340 domain-containing protein [Verrucomicrobiota bacterium]